MIIYNKMPVLFRINGFTIHSWGFFVSLGIIISLFLMMREFKQKREELLNLTIITMISAIIGARLLYVLLNLDYFLSHTKQVFNVMSGGLSLFGAIGLGLLGFIAYSKLRNLDYKKYLDIFSIYIPLSQSIGRIGCFFNGCCYGSITRVPWGITYLGGIRHPAQIYESILDFLLFLYLHSIRNKKILKIPNLGLPNSRLRLKLKHGDKFLLYLMLYSIIRFIVEFYREEPRLLFNLTITQYFTIGMIIIVLLILKTRLVARSVTRRSVTRAS